MSTTKREPLPIVIFKPLQCPRCDSDDVVTFRTVRDGLGDVNRYTKCRSCKKNFLVIIEKENY